MAALSSGWGAASGAPLAIRHHGFAEAAPNSPRVSDDGASPKRLLVSVNGSEHALHAVRHAIELYRQSGAAEIHLLNVQDTSQSARVHAFHSPEKLHALEDAAGDKVLQAARQLLDDAGVNYVSRVETGPVARTIAGYAEVHGCDTIVMGTRGHGAVATLLSGSTSIKVIHLTDVPVMLVK